MTRGGTTVTQAPPLPESQRDALHRRALHRRELRDLFRRMVSDRETAARLEMRAEQMTDPALADGLQERAGNHLLRAERARTVLVAEGVLGVRLPTEPD